MKLVEMAFIYMRNTLSGPVSFVQKTPQRTNNIFFGSYLTEIF